MISPVPGIQIEHQPEAVLRRMLAWGEARGEGPLGELAVMWVVRNRSVYHGYHEDTVMLTPRQFGCFNASDPNRPKLLMARKLDPSGWAAADAVATLFESKATVDPTLGSTHYYNPAVDQPNWGRGHPGWQERIVIGHHVFGVAA